MATLWIDTLQTMVDGVLYGLRVCLRAPLRVLRRISGRPSRCTAGA